MYSQANSGKSFKGSVSVEVFQGRLWLPRQLFGGKQKYLIVRCDRNPRSSARKQL
ncbi:MAG: hypothetical protein MUC48_10570 [Leptolyngbya sp. Prado105]|nr:hypothetical protein [Leptolyngbya sp. Prado105]